MLFWLYRGNDSKQIKPSQNPYNFLKKQSSMKKTAIIGIAIAIIVAGGLGIYAVSNTQEGPLGDESP